MDKAQGDEMSAKVEGTGKLTVDVNGPKGMKVDAEGGGLFKDVEINRSTQMLPAAKGPREDVARYKCWIALRRSMRSYPTTAWHREVWCNSREGRAAAVPLSSKILGGPLSTGLRQGRSRSAEIHICDTVGLCRPLQ